jgi:GntR family transcriptional regulator
MLFLTLKTMDVVIPKYSMIKSVIESRLEREYAVGDQLPTEDALCKEFGVSVITIRTALSLLADEGIISRHRGRGTFYRGPRVKRTDAKPSQLLQSLLRDQPKGFAQVEFAGYAPATPHVADILGVPVGAQVVAIDRVGFSDGEPVIFISAYLPRQVGDIVLKNIALLERFTLGEVVKEVAGIEIANVVQTIAATLADPRFAPMLGIPVGAPVLEGDRTYVDAAGRPVILSLAFYPANRTRFVVNLSGISAAD